MASVGFVESVVKQGTYASNIEDVEHKMLDAINELGKEARDCQDDLRHLQDVRTRLNRIKKALQTERIARTEEHGKTDPFVQTMERLRALEKAADAESESIKNVLLGNTAEQAKASRTFVNEVWNEACKQYCVDGIDFSDAWELYGDKWCDVDDHDTLFQMMSDMLKTIIDKGCLWGYKVFCTYDKSTGVDTFLVKHKDYKLLGKKFLGLVEVVA